MADGNRRILQDDFSAGAFPLASYDQIPGNGIFDAQNLLVDDDRSLKVRGGSRWAAPSIGAGTDLAWSWSGVIGSTPGSSSRTACGSRRSMIWRGRRRRWRAGRSLRPAGVSLAGLLFTPAGQAISPTLVVSAPALVRNCYAVAGNRLWAANLGSTRVDFSDVGVPGTFGGTSFHQVPEGGILGMIGLRDAVVIFTTAGCGSSPMSG
jgi:hypothetical protein